MSSNKHDCNSSVERHMLANQKVWGLILSQVVPRFCCLVQIHISFYTEITRENTSSKHRSYQRNEGNGFLSLTQVCYMCPYLREQKHNCTGKLRVHPVP